MKRRSAIVSLVLLIIILMNGWHSYAQDEPTPTPRESNLQRATVISPNLPPVSQSTLAPQASRTASLTPTSSPTATATSSATATQTQTATSSATATQTATSSPTTTQTATSSATATQTTTNSPTSNSSPTTTQTATSSATATQTATSSASATQTATSSATATQTITNSPTATQTLTATQTITNSPTATQTATNSPTPINISNIQQEVTPPQKEGMNPIVPITLATLGLISLYIIFYARNYARLDRYAAGFVIQTCPICQAGYLEIEERPHRVLGIPSVRRTIRCDNCRSILREVGRRRWRYAVDPYASQRLFEEYNGRDLTESELQALARPDSDDRLTRYVED